MTTSRLIGAVICSWLIQPFHDYFSTQLLFQPIYHCFLSKVYFVSRRHMNQIKTQRLPSITKAKFLGERKALKTTSIIVGFLFLSYVPSILHGVIRFTGVQLKQLHWVSIVFLCNFLNSLFNPLMYFWRNKDLRKVMMELLNIRQNGN